MPSQSTRHSPLSRRQNPQVFWSIDAPGSLRFICRVKIPPQPAAILGLLVCAALSGCGRSDPLKGSISEEEMAGKPRPGAEPAATAPKAARSDAREYAHKSFWEPPEAVDILEERARQGDITAQYWMGYLHEYGLKGLPKDPAAALEFYRLAAEQGYERAKLGVERLSAKTEGDAPDPARGEKNAATIARLQEAAQRGHAESLYLLGYYHEHGRYGLEKNISLAKDYYQKAAQQGNEKASIALERIEAEQ